MSKEHLLRCEKFLNQLQLKHYSLHDRKKTKNKKNWRGLKNSLSNFRYKALQEDEVHHSSSWRGIFQEHNQPYSWCELFTDFKSKPSPPLYPRKLKLKTSFKRFICAMQKLRACVCVCVCVCVYIAYSLSKKAKCLLMKVGKGK